MSSVDHLTPEGAAGALYDRAARLPDHLRASLAAAYEASFGEVPADLDLDTVGLDLLEGIGVLVRLKTGARRSFPGVPLTDRGGDGISESTTR